MVSITGIAGNPGAAPRRVEYAAVVTTTQLIALSIPLILVAIHARLMWVALGDLNRPDRRVRGYDKRTWALVIGFVGIVGPLAYFRAGREE